jgi:hypothetical protein
VHLVIHGIFACETVSLYTVLLEIGITSVKRWFREVWHGKPPVAVRSAASDSKAG